MFKPWRTFWNSLPGICQVCGAWPGRAVCDDCTARFRGDLLRCRACAAPLASGTSQCGACLKHPPPLQTCVAAVDYGYPWSELIARFKFRNEPGWAEPFAQCMLLAPQAAELLACSDLVIPVPLTPGRLANRGYNQAWELVKALKRQTPRATCHPPAAAADVLLRLLETPQQHRLARDQRLSNLQGVFVAHPQRLHRIAQARVLLVDDVMTTGATLHAAARALHQGGAAQVSALVFARTPPSHSS